MSSGGRRELLLAPWSGFSGTCGPALRSTSGSRVLTRFSSHSSRACASGRNARGMLTPARRASMSIHVTPAFAHLEHDGTWPSHCHSCQQAARRFIWGFVAAYLYPSVSAPLTCKPDFLALRRRCLFHGALHHGHFGLHDNDPWDDVLRITAQRARTASCADGVVRWRGQVAKSKRTAPVRAEKSSGV